MEVKQLAIGTRHLFAPVKESLPIGFDAEEFGDLHTQLVHLGELGQGVDPMGVLAIHSAHLDPHGGKPGTSDIRK